MEVTALKKWMKSAAAALTIAGGLSASTSIMAAPAQPAKMYINGLFQEDVLTVNGRTMIQLRAFNDPQSLNYSYDSSTKTIAVNNPVQKMTVHLKNGLKTA